MQTTQVFIVNVAKVGLEPTCNQLPFQQGISLSGYIAKKQKYVHTAYQTTSV